jgi:phosphoribosylamine--glycine ligase
VVLAAEGYPESPVKGRLIHGVTQEFIQSAETTAWVNHAGTGFDSNGNLISTGGRVLSCSASGPSLEESVRLAYELIESIELDGSHYRKDIAFRAL